MPWLILFIGWHRDFWQAQFVASPAAPNRQISLLLARRRIGQEAEVYKKTCCFLAVLPVNNLLSKVQVRGDWRYGRFPQFTFPAIFRKGFSLCIRQFL